MSHDNERKVAVPLSDWLLIQQVRDRLALVAVAGEGRSASSNPGDIDFEELERCGAALVTYDCVRTLTDVIDRTEGLKN